MQNFEFEIRIENLKKSIKNSCFFIPKQKRKRCHYHSPGVTHNLERAAPWLDLRTKVAARGVLKYYGGSAVGLT